MYEIARDFYNLGMYTEENLVVFIEAGFITEDQFAEITGHPYSTKIEASMETVTDTAEIERNSESVSLSKAMAESESAATSESVSEESSTSESTSHSDK